MSTAARDLFGLPMPADAISPSRAPLYTSPMPPTTDIVVAEVPCIGCGYNLHMQPAEGRCPECNAPVSRTLHNPLMTAGRNTVTSMGDTLMLTALMVMWFFVPFIALVVLLFSSGGVGPLPAVLSMAYFVYTLLYLKAVLSTTTIASDYFTRYRRTIFLSGIGALVAPFFIWAYFLSNNVTFFPFNDVTLFVPEVILFPSVVVFIWSSSCQYARVCESAALHDFAKQYRRIGLILGVAVGCVELVAAVIAIVVLLRDGFEWHLADLLIGIMSLGGLLLTPGLVLALFLQMRLSHRLTTFAATIPYPLILTGPAPLATTTRVG
jgi:hypothetical protein